MVQSNLATNGDGPEPMPAWISPENFEYLAEENVDNYEKIVNFEAKSALPPGENYSSRIVRVSFDVQQKSTTSCNLLKGLCDSDKHDSEKHLSYMIKLPHDTEQMRQMLALMNMFDFERDTLRDILPELEELYSKIGVDVKFGPTARLLPRVKDESYVLMDDLNVLGYKTANRMDCLDMDHSLLVLKKLAQYHASSACRVTKMGPYGDFYLNGISKDFVKDMWVEMMNGFKDAFLRNIKSLKDGDKYYKAVEKYFETLRSQFDTLFTYDPNDFNVLTHGDCWSNNFLFKYSATNKVEDVIFVDFQMPRWASPVQDLVYFIIASTRLDIKLSQFDYFLRYYYDHLVANLKLLKYEKPLPTLRDLHMQTFKYGGWAGISAFLALPIVLLPSTDNSRFENLMNDGEKGKDFKNQLYGNKVYQKYINEILPWLYQRGLLGSDEELIAVKDFIKVTKSSTPISITPAWLTAEAIHDVVQQKLPELKAIKDFAAVSATNLGDNYASTLLKISVNAELKDGSVVPTSYILKIQLVANESAQTMLGKYNLFEKENMMYRNVMPQFEQLYKAVGVDVVFGPKSYQFSKDPGCDYLLMENLQVLGFRNVDRFVGLDKAHAKSVLKKLSEFHAASACYHATNGPYPELLEKGMFDMVDEEMFRIFRDSLSKLLAHCMNSYERVEEYRETLTNNWMNRFEKIMKAASYFDESRFNVLNHGDTWTNNIMFQYDNAGQIANTYFVDFQMCKWGSPAQDLYYFAMSSLTLDVKLDNFDELIEYYYENLKANLLLLKYAKPIPTMEDLQEDLMQYGMWAYLTIIGTMAVVLADPSKDASMENMVADTEAANNFKMLMYTNPRYKQHAEKLLYWAYKRGLCDVNIDKMLQQV